MSQQGEMPAAHEDDWWRRLYDETAPDTGAGSAADSLDDRFDSASGAVSSGGAGASGTDPGGDPGGTSGTSGAPGTAGAVGLPDSWRAPSTPPQPSAPPQPAAPSTTTAQPAPWEAPVAGPRPRTFTAPPPPPTKPSPSEPTPHPEYAPRPDRNPDRTPLPEPVPPPFPEPVPETAAPALPAPAQAPPLPRRPAASEPVIAARATPPRPPAEPEQEPEPPGPPAHRPAVAHVGDRPPTYESEPTALPATDPQELDALVPDTVLDGARYGTYTLRAASVRGDSARFRGRSRRDALLTVRFGTGESALVLVAVGAGAHPAASAHPAAADACRWIAGAVGRSHARLSEDIRTGRRSELKSGLHRLVDRTYGRLRARAAELGLDPQEYTAGLRCVLLPADPGCRTRVFFGVGDGGLFRLRDGAWHDLEPRIPATASAVAGSGPATAQDPATGDLTMDLGIVTASGPYAEAPPPPPAEPFRFRTSVARPGDTLLLCSAGLAAPLRGEPALAGELAARWAGAPAPGLAEFLADSQLRVKGYADDRTTVGVWEA